MPFKKILFLCFRIAICNTFSYAQVQTPKTDSTHIYKNIESYSIRHGFTKILYGLLFTTPVIDSIENHPKKKVYKKRIQKPYGSFEGKVIRHIIIETLDPFGNSISDTSYVEQNFLFKAGNKVHIKSKQATIRDFLLIRQNQRFDSLLVKESERLVRLRKFVHDVSFKITVPSKNSDSVDIFIRELDNWSIIPELAFSPSSFIVDLTDKNFLGLGHEYRNDFTWIVSTGKTRYATNYFIPNIHNTYINSTLNYSNDDFGNFTRSFAVDRPFFSPFAKWAAGADFNHTYHKDIVLSTGNIPVEQNNSSNSQDYWAGNAFQIFRGNSENSRMTNFISSLRYVQKKYSQKPIESMDTFHVYSDERFFLSSVGISTRKYVQDKFIFKYGVTEDLPVGQVYSLTGGYQIKNNIGRIYLGTRISKGNYFPWGYLSSDFEYGIFFRNSKAQQGTLSASITYFTGLVEIGTWNFRQFVKPRITIGINRFANENLTLNDGFGLDGFNSPTLSGTDRLLFTFQTQSYSPWNFIGFRFGPFVSYSLGALGDASIGFENSRIYSLIGLGVLINNENLVFNTFQISISFYPLIPNNGQDVFKINTFKTTNFSFKDFEIGKPFPVVFQ